jgi:hypothetical protein
MASGARRGRVTDPSCKSAGLGRRAAPVIEADQHEGGAGQGRFPGAAIIEPGRNPQRPSRSRFHTFNCEKSLRFAQA